MSAHLINYTRQGQFSSCDTFEKTPGALESVSHRLSWDWPLSECFNYLQTSTQDQHTLNHFFLGNMRVPSCFCHKTQAQSVPAMVTLPGDQMLRAQCLRLSNTPQSQAVSRKSIILIIAFSTRHKAFSASPFKYKGQSYSFTEKMRNQTPFLPLWVLC